MPAAPAESCRRSPAGGVRRGRRAGRPARSRGRAGPPSIGPPPRPGRPGAAGRARASHRQAPRSRPSLRPQPGPGTPTQAPSGRGPGSGHPLQGRSAGTRSGMVARRARPAHGRSGTSPRAPSVPPGVLQHSVWPPKVLSPSGVSMMRHPGRRRGRDLAKELPARARASGPRSLAGLAVLRIALQRISPRVGRGPRIWRLTGSSAPRPAAPGLALPCPPSSPGPRG